MSYDMCLSSEYCAQAGLIRVVGWVEKTLGKGSLPIDARVISHCRLLHHVLLRTSFGTSSETKCKMMRMRSKTLYCHSSTITTSHDSDGSTEYPIEIRASRCRTTAFISMRAFDRVENHPQMCKVYCLRRAGLVQFDQL